MLKDIFLLLKLQLMNFLGFNTIKYSKDKNEKKRTIGMAILWIIIIIILQTE